MEEELENEKREKLKRNKSTKNGGENENKEKISLAKRLKLSKRNIEAWRQSKKESNVEEESGEEKPLEASKRKIMWKNM